MIRITTTIITMRIKMRIRKKKRRRGRRREVGGDAEGGRGGGEKEGMERIREEMRSTMTAMRMKKTSNLYCSESLNNGSLFRTNLIAVKSADFDLPFFISMSSYQTKCCFLG